MPNFRLLYQKKETFKTTQQEIQKEITEVLQLPIKVKRVLFVYDIFGCTEEQYNKLKTAVLLDAVTDNEVTDFLAKSSNYFAMEFLPGQFDARADSALQALQLLSSVNLDAKITTGTVVEFEEVTTGELEKLSSYFINPVEKRLKDMRKTLEVANVTIPQTVPNVIGFISFSEEQIIEFKKEQGLAMNIQDLLFIQEYFKNEEKREPTETEIKLLDTYWSDHCRHSTFLAEIKNVSFEEGEYTHAIKKAFQQYKAVRKEVYAERLDDKAMNLMDLATLAAKDLKKKGILTTVEESEEINACSVYQTVQTENGEEEWLLMFKNETHNHPTEIEPFGGASTCLGGCIRDPLSGRAYAYQAMRVSGAANILEAVDQTITGKLPQKQITQGAAHGFSSYGNQIGLATTHVAEVFHPGYKAKRMEVGAVVAAAPADWVKREQPEPGDVILLLGGKTGRDGVGGATGSSKEHTEESLETAGAEVQKGNPPEERKIQRLFRNPAVTQLIKRCNDFGAGGVSVAIGELADGLHINLDMVSTKYAGLTGTEIALSESQERMAVVIKKEDLSTFKDLAAKENLDAAYVADVTDTNRLVMEYKGQKVVDISRAFLDTNGVLQQTAVHVQAPLKDHYFTTSIEVSPEEALLSKLSGLNTASQQGLGEQFDSTIGSSTIHMPYGGVYQLTPSEGSVQSFPVLQGETNTASAMTWGFDPQLSAWSPFHGGSYAVVESLAKLVALGANHKNAYFTFQEYFRKMGNDPSNWGQPFAALLGAFQAQEAFECAAIGGKDSMSGTFNDIHVPPTLISFAVAALDATQSISNELKTTDSFIYLLKHQPNIDYTPNYEQLNQNFDWLHQQIKEKKIFAAGAVGNLGIATKLAQMAFGNKIGFHLITPINLFETNLGSILIESGEELVYDNLHLLGKTDGSNVFTINQDEIEIEKAISAWQNTLESIFPTKSDNSNKVKSWESKNIIKAQKPNFTIAKPKVFIPAFPGTNCEYDSQKAFRNAGADPHISVFRNEKQSWIDESIEDFVKQVNNAQILMVSGGFSAGDEPDGSGKFIAAVLRNERIKEAVHKFLENDGLILGICNGFQALIKSGLLPFGQIGSPQEEWPTLAHNEIGRHISQIVRTKIVNNHSPWLSSYEKGEQHQIAISHGEGRFVVREELAKSLFEKGQIATQYVDLYGEATLQRPFNPNGAFYAIEGITSEDGRILGKMGHSERKGQYLYQNIPGEVGQDIFSNGVKYFN